MRTRDDNNAFRQRVRCEGEPDDDRRDHENYRTPIHDSLRYKIASWLSSVLAPHTPATPTRTPSRMRAVSFINAV